jgi:hypothetical protein
LFRGEVRQADFARGEGVKRGAHLNYGPVFPTAIDVCMPWRRREADSLKMIHLYVVAISGENRTPLFLKML